MMLRSLKMSALVLGAAVVVGAWLVIVDVGMGRALTLLADRL